MILCYICLCHRKEIHGVIPHLRVQFKPYTLNEFAFARSYIFWDVMLGH
jgi:hypothetical protein